VHYLHIQHINLHIFARYIKCIVLEYNPAILLDFFWIFLNYFFLFKWAGYADSILVHIWWFMANHCMFFACYGAQSGILCILHIICSLNLHLKLQFYRPAVDESPPVSIIIMLFVWKCTRKAVEFWAHVVWYGPCAFHWHSNSSKESLSQTEGIGMMTTEPNPTLVHLPCKPHCSHKQ
jgi:hypothetical protein